MPTFAYPNIQSSITMLIDQFWNNTYCNDSDNNNFDDSIDIKLDDESDIQIHFNNPPPHDKAPGEIMI